MHAIDHPHRLQHPAVSAALSARNAIAAEMAVAGRAGHRHGDPCWGEARRALLEPDDASWVLASDAYAQMREDLACDGPTPDDSLGAHGAALRSLAVPVAGAGAAALRADAAPRVAVHKPAARRRREWLATAGWFAVGGTGGLLLACAVRVIEVVLAWR